MASEGKSGDEPVRRPNSTSSMYISSTMSVPDNDEIMLSVGTVIKCILTRHSSKGDFPIDSNEEFRLFDERFHNLSPLEQKEMDMGAYDHGDYLDLATASAEAIFHFLKSVFEMAQFSPECNTISLVLINRFLNKTKMILHAYNWRALLLCSLLIAQKIWDDRCLTNVDFPVIWRHAVPGVKENTFTLKMINKLEIVFLGLIRYNVYVSGSLYAKYYFELRTLHESNNENGGASTKFPKPLSKGQAARLEARSAAQRDELKNNSAVKKKDKKARSLMSSMTGNKGRAVLS